MLAVPAGNEVAFHYDATGVQIYTCTSTATGYSWVFQATQVGATARVDYTATYYFYVAKPSHRACDDE